MATATIIALKKLNYINLGSPTNLVSVARAHVCVCEHTPQPCQATASQRVAYVRCKCLHHDKSPPRHTRNFHSACRDTHASHCRKCNGVHPAVHKHTQGHTRNSGTSRNLCTDTCVQKRFSFGTIYNASSQGIPGHTPDSSGSLGKSCPHTCTQCTASNLCLIACDKRISVPGRYLTFFRHTHPLLENENGLPTLRGASVGQMRTM